MRTLKVFVADDHRACRILARDLLSMRGHEVIEHDGQSPVLAAIALARPDIAVLDVRLGHQDGHAIVRAMKAEPSLAGIPVAAYTARAFPDEVAAVWEAGFDAYIRKPVAISKFVEAVEDLGRRLSERERVEHIVVGAGRGDGGQIPFLCGEQDRGDLAGDPGGDAVMIEGMACVLQKAQGAFGAAGLSV